ncbi:Eco57I restriction-modification methylase domain-containing protein [Halalkalibacter akibai]|uniref:site-specific DNA-methyltransferase (adenine-specific) n=1 Tax=Halalkalibacter akibai (strain ATCC 43226 / DSM 21942 / CIP 109018 / JCM 9157 / 1139) TaxID=1236973 RepID=W4QTA8_HALA3|nr:TaqI-like C-terminal specificity domain-containing protein [Halalkalibacter akibai]GAE35375.1 hypothetical protein JCM9157_2477 [Halalkalibacter akibai JCM 9157]
MNLAIKLKSDTLKRKWLRALEHVAEQSKIIEGLYQDDYYASITEEEVDFLNDVEPLSALESSLKLKVFHCFLEIVSTEVFKKVINADRKLRLDFPSSKLMIDKKEFYNWIDNEVEVGQFEKVHVFFETLYPDLVSSLSRKSSGTEFTSIQVVNFMLDEVGYKSDVINKKIMDPSAGAGVFIISALGRYLNRCNVSYEVVKQKLIVDKNLVAVDLNPFNVLITKLRFVLKLVEHYGGIDNHEIKDLLKRIPIKVANTIMQSTSPLLANNVYDYVIGNPPYIRIQRLPMEERQYLKKNYSSATGRFDLYVCFMEKAVNLLRNGGKLSLITSNKFLTTNYGIGVRNFLLTQTSIEHLVDLHDTPFFQAAILPAIITATKKADEQSEVFQYTSIKRSNNGLPLKQTVTNVFEYVAERKKKKAQTTEQLEMKTTHQNVKVEISHALVKVPSRNETWNFTSVDEASIKSHIESISHHKMHEVAKVSVGVKPNPNKVFVDPMTMQFVTDNQFEQDLVFPILQKGNVGRWKVNWSIDSEDDRFILYPHKMENGKGVAVDLELYPNAKKYIFEHEDILKNRPYLTKSNTRKWYEIWVPHDLEKFTKPKIVTKDISEKNNFALDENGYICLGTIFWMYIKEEFKSDFLTEEQLLYYLLGLCNSNVLEFYQKTISGSLFSKKVRYTSSNINKWIVPRVTTQNLSIISEIVSIVSTITKDGQIKKCEDKLNKLIYILFKLGSDQIQLIEQYNQTNS